LETDQVFHLAVSAFICIILTAGYFYQPKKKRISLTVLLGAGILITSFGVLFSCLDGRNCISLLMFNDTGGFGRAYVTGIGVILSSILIFLLRYLKNNF
jgi:hypothetical protein